MTRIEAPAGGDPVLSDDEPRLSVEDELRARIDNLQLALEHRDVIGQAKGFLMATYRVSSEEAFSMLVSWSQRDGRKLFDLASKLVSELAQHPASAV